MSADALRPLAVFDFRTAWRFITLALKQNDAPLGAPSENWSNYNERTRN